jgi:hypothetical protein
MSTRCEIKFRADRDLRDQFDRHCAQLNTDRTGRMNALMIADIEDRIVSSPGTRPAPQKPISDTDKMVGAFDGLKANLDALFAKNRENISKALAPLSAIPTRLETQKHFDDVGTQQKWTKGQLDNLKAEGERNQSQIMNALENIYLGLKVNRPALHLDSRFHGGVVAGILGLIVLLALIPGDWKLSHNIARSIMGERNTAAAASALLEKDYPGSGPLVTSTIVLSQNAKFKNSYWACVDKMRVTRTGFSCPVDMPGLQQPIMQQ